MPNLNEHDRRAIDLFLDHEQVSQTTVFISSEQSDPTRVKSVEKILSLLQALAPAEPPTDLVSKTLRRVDQALAAIDQAHHAAGHQPNDLGPLPPQGK
jgi:hypothetical protein